MMTKNLFILVVASPIFLAAGWSSGVGGELPSDASTPIAVELFEWLDATPSECPTAVSAFDGGSNAACANIDLAWGPLKKKTQKFLRARESEAQRWYTFWTREEGRRTRWLLSGRERPWKMVFDPKARWLALIPSHPCYPSDQFAAMKVIELDDVDSLPVLEQRINPEFPEEARAHREEGFVLAEVILEPDGRVGDLCIIEETPRGLGFTEAAVTAISEWRYAPARKNGNPVRTSVVTSVSWTYGPP
jgi:protein TonB